MSKLLNDLRMYKCILVLRSAVQAKSAGYAFGLHRVSLVYARLSPSHHS